MADIWTKQKRSAVMALIRSHGNKDTELRLMAIFRVAGLKGWRRHLPLPGKPDFVFRAERVAIFVDGCFWHGCSRCYRRPASNRAYWDGKVQRNRERDLAVSRALRVEGWRVVRIWEHELKAVPALVRRVRRALEGASAGSERVKGWTAGDRAWNGWRARQRKRPPRSNSDGKGWVADRKG